MNRTDILKELVDECMPRREISEEDCKELPLLAEALRYYDNQRDIWAGFRVARYDCVHCKGTECLTHKVRLILLEIMTLNAELHDAALRMERAIYPWGIVDDDFHTSLICIGYKQH